MFATPDCMRLLAYRFANVHVATVLDGYLALLVLLLWWPARQRREALVHNDALLDPGTTTQRPHSPGQYYGHGAQAQHEQREYGDHDHHDLDGLARRHARMVEHGHFRVIKLPAVAPEQKKNRFHYYPDYWTNRNIVRNV